MATSFPPLVLASGKSQKLIAKMQSSKPFDLVTGFSTALVTTAMKSKSDKASKRHSMLGFANVRIFSLYQNSGILSIDQRMWKKDVVKH